MKFTYQIPKLKKIKIDNRRFRMWLEDEQGEELTLYEDEINFSTIILNGAIKIDSIKLGKFSDQVVADVLINKWSKYFISTVYGGFYVFCIFNVPNSLILKWTLGMILLAVLMYLLAYPILKYEVKSSLISEIK
ncbi:hypothetical protein SHI21_17540 [Bacteriovorax sp. PP10]|uniref:Uncharacterized protein n=1 Tax=Bacteriovorax antarcticus TaxID=3088717 RepID=A0ABU5W1A1_9BACT|nr:hypothetical protein [Bacteriovorax sp. PP10]MEA9358040.1 hypothetical protein [Bacteriovorax sp. PP10]